MHAGPKHVALLTGAGFSKNWGGYLASEIAEPLLPALASEQRLREELIKTGNYEKVLGEAELYDAIPEAHKLRSLLLDVFGQHDEIIRAGTGSVSNHLIEGFLGCFFRADSTDTGWIFTLNQDLLIERHLNFNLPFVTPGVPMDPWHSQGSLKYSPDLHRKVIGAEAAAAVDYDALAGANRRNYIKLHGSFDWKDEHGRSLLIAGNLKHYHIAANQYLSRCMDVFKRVLKRERTKLVVIGYSFADPHVNEAIYEAIPQGIELYIINPEPMGSFARRLLSKDKDLAVARGGYILGRIHGYWSRPLSEVFGTTGYHPETEHARAIYRACFGVELP
jgi:hypothetical protein